MASSPPAATAPGAASQAPPPPAAALSSPPATQQQLLEQPLSPSAAGPSSASRQELLEQLASHFSCSICYDLLCQPVVGSCGHDFCRRCLSQWARRQRGRGTMSVKCPVCRSVFAASAHDLAVCIKLRDTLELLFPERLAARDAEVREEEEREAAEEAAEAAARRAARQAAAAAAATAAIAAVSASRTAVPGGASPPAAAAAAGNRSVPALVTIHRPAQVTALDDSLGSIANQLHALRAALGLPSAAGGGAPAAGTNASGPAGPTVLLRPNANINRSTGNAGASDPNTSLGGSFPAGRGPAPGGFGGYLNSLFPPTGYVPRLQLDVQPDGVYAFNSTFNRPAPQQQQQQPPAVDPFGALPRAVDVSAASRAAWQAIYAEQHEQQQEQQQQQQEQAQWQADQAFAQQQAALQQQQQAQWQAEQQVQWQAEQQAFGQQPVAQQQWTQQQHQQVVHLQPPVAPEVVYGSFFSQAPQDQAAAAYPPAPPTRHVPAWAPPASAPPAAFTVGWHEPSERSPVSHRGSHRRENIRFSSSSNSNNRGRHNSGRHNSRGWR